VESPNKQNKYNRTFHERWKALITDFKIPYTDVKALTGDYVEYLWQNDLDNKLYKTTPIVSIP
jgi:hypothetical protein